MVTFAVASPGPRAREMLVLSTLVRLILAPNYQPGGRGSCLRDPYPIPREVDQVAIEVWLVILNELLGRTCIYLCALIDTVRLKA